MVPAKMTLFNVTEGICAAAIPAMEVNAKTGIIGGPPTNHMIMNARFGISSQYRIQAPGKSVRIADLSSDNVVLRSPKGRHS